MRKINLMVIENNKVYTDKMVERFNNSNDILVKYVAHDGKEALKMIKENKNAIDFIVMDPLLPNMDGIAILKKMKEKDIKIKTIITSAAVDLFMLGELREYPIVSCFMKPYDIMSLQESIEYALKTEETRKLKIQQVNNLKKRVTDLLHELGVPSNLKGFLYLREAITLVYYEPDLAHKITKVLYPRIAKTFDSTPQRVERSIRHAIETSWNRANWETMERIFGCSVSIDRAKPTNSEYIVTLADLLHMEDDDIQ